ncbi:MAG: nucleoside-diphosphate kinase [Candidatus Obscuribacterales bacterium]|nr:nucleoside-diphosphate kinase [Candidatus Obscuribacterales bacterium]
MTLCRDLQKIEARNLEVKKKVAELQRTFVAIKPDGVQRGLIGEIVSRFEKKGLKLVGLKLMQVSRELAENHYGEHKGKPFFEGLVSFITSGPIVAMVLEGKDAVAIARNLIGATNPASSAPGTIRGDLALEIGRNVVHGSDSPESGKREIGIFFNEKELADWTRTVQCWVTE